MGCLPFLVLFNFISEQTGNIFIPNHSNSPAHPQPPQAVQGRSQKLKLILLYGGFVFLLEGREFTASGVTSGDVTFILVHFTITLKL